MEQYYVIHDYDNLQMGFVPFSGSAKSLPEAAVITDTYPINVGLIGTGCNTIAGMPTWAFCVMIIGCCAVVGIGIWAAFAFCLSFLIQGAKPAAQLLSE